MVSAAVRASVAAYVPAHLQPTAIRVLESAERQNLDHFIARVDVHDAAEALVGAGILTAEGAGLATVYRLT